VRFSVKIERWKVASACAAVALLLCAACSSSASSSQAAAGSSKPPAQLTKITIASGVHGLGFAPLYLAQQAGYFADEGLDVTIANLAGAGAVNSAIISGSVPLGFGGGLDAVKAAASGQPVRLIGIESSKTASDLTVSNAFLSKAGVTATSPFEDRVKALAGTTIATSAVGTGGYVFFSDLLTTFGMTPNKDVKLVGLGGEPATLATALQHGQIQGAIQSPPTDKLIVQSGGGTIYVNPMTENLTGNAAYLGDLPVNGIVASQKALTDPAQSKEIEAALRATVRATLLIKQHPATAAAFLEKAFPSIATSVIQSSMQELAPVFPANPAPTDVLVNNAIRAEQEYAKTSSGPSMPSQVAVSSVSDPTPANQAYAAVAGNGQQADAAGNS
jgi:NitT/TauT family transport system substrate-binding protein